MINVVEWDLQTYGIVLFLLFQAVIPLCRDIWKRSKKPGDWAVSIAWLLLCWWLFVGLADKGVLA